MDGLTVFGLFAVTAMLIFYALEKRSEWFILAFAGSCVMASAYGFYQGASRSCKRRAFFFKFHAVSITWPIFITFSWLLYDFFRPFAVRFNRGRTERNVTRL